MGRTSKREEIAQAALELRTRGFNATGMSDSTSAAGAPKGSFYNHFASKEESALEALSRNGAGMQWETLSAPGRPALERLRAYFESLGNDTVDSGFARGGLIGNLGAEMADHSEEIRSAVNLRFRRWTSRIEQVLAEAKDAGELDAALDLEATALFILRSVNNGAAPLCRVRWRDANRIRPLSCDFGQQSEVGTTGLGPANP